MIKIKNWLLRPMLLILILATFATGDSISSIRAQQCDYCEAIEGESGDGGQGGGSGDVYTCPSKYGCGNLGCRAKSILDPTQICTQYVIVPGSSCPSPITCQKAPK